MQIKFESSLFPLLVNPIPEIRKLLDIPESKSIYFTSNPEVSFKVNGYLMKENKSFYTEHGVKIHNLEEDIDYFLIDLPKKEILSSSMSLSPALFVIYDSSKFCKKYVETKIEEICKEGERSRDQMKNLLFLGKLQKLIPKRSLDTIWIPKEQKNRVLKRVERFFSKEGREFSEKHGFRHKQCHIFAGLPGTGKSVFVHAIASKFNLVIFHIDMADPSFNPCDKIKMAPPGSIVLIEDIDTSFRGLNGDDQGSKNMIISSFLNTLDGIDCADNVSIFITCNDTSILNLPAVRKGRFNYLEQFKEMNAETLSGMISSYYPETDVSEVNSLAEYMISMNNNIIPCDIEQYFLENYDSFEAFSKTLRFKFESSRRYFEKFHESIRYSAQRFRPDSGSTMIM